jgi:hypothetical protein
MEHPGGAMSTMVAGMDGAGQNVAVIYGSKARIEIAPIWYAPTSFKVVAHNGELLEEFSSEISGRGMQFQAFEMERLVKTGEASRLMPPDDSVLIMETLDAIRQQIGLNYPGETVQS